MENTMRSWCWVIESICSAISWQILCHMMTETSGLRDETCEGSFRNTGRKSRASAATSESSFTRVQLQLSPRLCLCNSKQAGAKTQHRLRRTLDLKTTWADEGTRCRWRDGWRSCSTLRKTPAVCQFRSASSEGLGLCGLWRRVLQRDLVNLVSRC